jgi:hypothetical protein
MKKLSYFIVAGVLTLAGVVGVLVKRSTTNVVRQEVPDRPTQRGPASPDPATSSQPAALSIRPSSDVGSNLNLTEEQIQTMEQDIATLQKDVSVFKDSEAWVVRFHHTSAVMSSLGVKDGDQISFKQLDEMKQEAALEGLTRRLENILLQLQK